MIPPKRLIFFPLTGECSKGLDTFRLIFKQQQQPQKGIYVYNPIILHKVSRLLFTRSRMVNAWRKILGNWDLCLKRMNSCCLDVNYRIQLTGNHFRVAINNLTAKQLSTLSAF